MSAISYEILQEGSASLPSCLCLLLSADLEEPSVSSVNSALERHFGDALLQMTPTGGTGSSWSADIDVQLDGQTYEYHAWLQYNEDLHELHFSKPGFTEAALESIKKCNRTLKVQTIYGDETIADFHHHLKFVCALDVDFLAVLDSAACVLRTEEWVRFNASNTTPPSP
ncbi:MAG: hypothetical protein ACI8W8_005075 [Rhodothermales bacterium]|jgi:hypothetical protein